MTLSFLYRAFCRVLQLIRLIGRSDTDLAIEVFILRHEVAVLRRQVHRPALQSGDRAVLAGLARLLPRRRLGHFFVQPATLLGWYRDLVAKRWTYSPGRPGRPAIAKGTTALVLRLAKENPTWGYRRIHGELTTMGVTIAASSVWTILKHHGVEPSPRRSGPTWAELLAAQAKGLMAYDLRCRHRLSPQALRPRVHPPRHASRADRRRDGICQARANAICERVISTLRRECLPDAHPRPLPSGDRARRVRRARQLPPPPPFPLPASPVRARHGSCAHR